MAFAVGVDFGSTKTRVTIIKGDTGSAWDVAPALVAAAVPSVVFLGENQEFAIGDHAEKLGVTDPHRVIRDFKRRVGDAVPIVADGWCESPEAIVAAFVRRVIEDVTDLQHEDPAAVALAYPAQWGSYKQSLLKDALRDVGLGDVLLVAEPAAAASSAAELGGADAGTVLVYDLGAGSFDATILIKTPGEEFAVAGTPQGLDWMGGDDFDQAVFSWVRHNARLEVGHDTDAELLTQMSRLREACTQAKESLSMDTEVTIAVATAGLRTRVRLVRAEFEELIRDEIGDTLNATRKAINSAGLTVDDIDAIVLVGGSARIPLVAQLLSAEFSLPIVVGSSPEVSISLGAARLAATALRSPEVLSGAAQTSVADVPAAAIVAPHPAVEEAPTGRPTWLGDSERELAPRTDSGHELPSSPPTSPVRIGRHRHRRRRRFGLRTAGLCAAVAALILAGSSLAASQTDSNSSITRFESGDPVTTTSTVVVGGAAADSTQP